MWKDEKESHQFKQKDGNVPKIEQRQMEINQDVRDHENELSTGDWPIVAKNIDKTYKKLGLHAVCSNSFGVQKGSILGLLGPNGAGKSSTFGMLAMERQISHGEAYILS